MPLKSQYVRLFYSKKQLEFLRKLKLISVKFNIRRRKKLFSKKRLIKIIKILNKRERNYKHKRRFYFLSSDRVLKCKKIFWSFFFSLYKNTVKITQFYFFNRKNGLFNYLSQQFFLKLKLAFFFVLLRFNFLKIIIIFRNYFKNFLFILNIFRHQDIEFLLNYFIKNILVLFFVNFDYQHKKIFKKFPKTKFSVFFAKKNSRIFWFYNRLVIKKQNVSKKSKGFMIRKVASLKKKLILTTRLFKYSKSLLKKKFYYNKRKFKKFRSKGSFKRLKNFLLYDDFFTLADMNSNFLKLKPIFVNHRLHFFGKRLRVLINRKKLTNKKKKVLYKSDNSIKMLKVMRRFIFFKYRLRFVSFIIRRIKNIILANNNKDNLFIEKSKKIASNKTAKPIFFSSYLNFILSKQNLKINSYNELFFNVEKKIFFETIL